MQSREGASLPSNEDIGYFSALYSKDPLRWTMWAFPWDTDKSLQMIKLQEPWASRFPDFKYGPDAWFCELCDDWREHILKTNFDGKKAVEPFRAARTSGHGIGKSAGSAIVMLFIASTRPFCKGVVTANTSDQLKSKTWAELAKWKGKCATGEWFVLNSGKGNMRLCHAEHQETWRIDALTCREENSESFAGLHNAASTPFYLFDEASAIPDKIWEVAEGGMTDGEPFWFVFGNPTRNTGRFRDCFRKYSKRWNNKRIDSRKCQITNKEQIQTWLEDYGEDSDFFKVRVRGEFPSQSVRQFIPEDLVLKAQSSGIPYESYKHAPVILTLDPAWMGDDELVIGKRQGLHFEILHRQQKNNNDVEVANRLARYEDQYGAAAVFVDGGYGTGIVSVGQTMGRDWQLVWFGSKPFDEMYHNKRAEMWGLIAEWLKSGGCLPDDNDLFIDLTSPEVKPRMDGKILLESKEDMKKRGLKSPNCGDALALSFAMPVMSATSGKPRTVRKLRRYN